MQSNRQRGLLLLAWILFWILFVLGGYYYFHKPINLQNVAAPISAFLDIVFLLLFAGLAGGIGRRILPAPSIPPLERAAVQFALGAGILSFIWLVLGVLGLYRFPLGAPMLLLGVLLFQRAARAWYGQLHGLVDAWRQAGRLEKILAAIAAILIFYQLLIALAPPVKWDALAYHLQLPRQFLAAGGLVFIPENPYWGHPEIVEMLYTFAMSFHRAETAAVLGWGSGVIFLSGILGFTNSQTTRLKQGSLSSQGSHIDSHPATAGWIAIAAVMAGVSFRYLMGWSYTDLFAALFGLAATITFFAWMDEQQPGWFLWTGLFCGMALGVKWTEGLLPLGLFIAALLFAKQTGLSLKTWLLAGGIAVAAIFPWLLKNILATGSPLYPYVFATAWIDAARMASANLPPQTIDWWLHLLTPISTTLTGVDSAAGFSTDLGPLLLLFAAPGFWLYRHTKKAQTLAILLSLAVLSLGVASLRFEHLGQTRLYFALLPALILPCGWGWEWLQRQVPQGVRLRRIFGAVILLVLGLAFWQDSIRNAQDSPGGVLLGTETRQTYLENNIGYTIRAMQALQQLPTSAHILMLWEPRGLYAPLNAQADLWIDRWRTDRRELQSAAAIQAEWKRQGFTHLLVYQPGTELIRPQNGQPPSADWTVFQDLVGQLSQPVSIGGEYTLYVLK